MEIKEFISKIAGSWGYKIIDTCDDEGDYTICVFNRAGSFLMSFRVDKYVTIAYSFDASKCTLLELRHFTEKIHEVLSNA